MRNHTKEAYNRLQSPQRVALLRASSTSPQQHGNCASPNNFIMNENSNLNNRNENNNNQVDNRNSHYNNSNFKTTGISKQNSPSGFNSDKFEIPLPFGYHLDLDFLRFCTDELVSGETLEKLKELRKARRQQRKTLEALMGIRQEQRETYRKKAAMKEHRPPPALTHTSTLTVLHSPGSSPSAAYRNPSPDFMKDALFDFEQCLYSTQDLNRMTSFDLIYGSKEAREKYNTYPGRQPFDDQPPNASSTPAVSGKNVGLTRQHSNSSLSSISTNSSALPYNVDGASFLLAKLPSSVPAFKQDSLETESITSITSEMSATMLRSVREQMAKSLAKLKQYEKQVEAIPVMQIKLSVMKEEKRLLMLKLRQRELHLRKERVESVDEMLSAPEDFFEGDIDTDFEAEDLDQKGTVRTRWRTPGPQRRARSESPYAKQEMVRPDEFLSIRKKRSTSCGYNSDTTDASRYFEAEFSTRRVGRSSQKHSAWFSPTERSEVSIYTNGSSQRTRVSKEVTTTSERKETKEAGTVTESLPKPVSRWDRGTNTDPPPRSSLPSRKISHGTNTVGPRTMARSTSTVMKMESFVTIDEMEAKVQEAVFKTEEEIMGCPLLQKAMAKVEEEALNGPSEGPVETLDAQCQVGEENLRPFVIDIGLQVAEEQIPGCESYCNARALATSAPQSTKDRFLAAVGAFDLRPALRSVGVGDCKVIEDPPDPTRYRETGVCTEKWIEVIKASKQTDTEDFAFKDTESPRVVDVFPFEPEPDRMVLERRSSLRRSMGALPSSPYLSRKSSAASSPVVSRQSTAASPAKTLTKTVGTNTDKSEDQKPKIVKKDAKTQNVVSMKNASTSALMLPLGAESKPIPGSPLTTPDSERATVNLNLCDKCSNDIKEVAEGILASKSLAKKVHQPPSPDMPWLSKIPRPVPENPDVHRLKAASSIGNLSLIDSRPRSPAAMQRSKSNLSPSFSRRLLSPKSSTLSPPPRGNVTGTPPPHPSTPPVGARRVSSPLARSHSPQSWVAGGETRKSLIPKLSPAASRKATSDLGSPSGLASPLSLEASTLIPRIVTPPALRKMYPKDGPTAPDRDVARKQTFTKSNTGVSNPHLDKGKEAPTKIPRKLAKPEWKLEKDDSDAGKLTEEDESNKRLDSSVFPVPGTALFTPIDENRKKAEPSKEVKAALKVLNDSFAKGSSISRPDVQVTSAVNIVQQEWFKTSSTKQSSSLDVEDYLDAMDSISKELLNRVVNMTDVNGNTALHYSVSHGNFDVVSVLLDSKVANQNILNKAGYTCIMLIALAHIANGTHRAVISRLFTLGDVNVRASQHGQTALMLAVSHGRLDMVQLLVEAGAAVDIADEDGSTALMCAAEHGYVDIVKYILAQPDTDVNRKDNDGLTALSVAMEAGHRDIGIILYAAMSFSRGASPHSSIRVKKHLSSSSSRTNTPPIRGTVHASNKTPTSSLRGQLTPQNALRSRHNSSNS